jgi:hypothetical protein
MKRWAKVGTELKGGDEEKGRRKVSRMGRYDEARM